MSRKPWTKRRGQKASDLHPYRKRGQQLTSIQRYRAMDYARKGYRPALVAKMLGISLDSASYWAKKALKAEGS